MSDHLLRGRAPISDGNWTDIDDEARTRLSPALAARRLVEFSGPFGWEYSATNLGRVEPIDVEGLEAARRRVMPVVELRVPFGVSRAELRDGDRGAADVDYAELDAAARRIAIAENAIVFHGSAAAGVEGIASSSPHDVVECGEDAAGYPGAVARALDLLKRNGIGGPYGLALSREDWTRVVETTEQGGWLLFDHLRRLLDGPLVWSPGVQGAVVVSLRGGDFLFESGQDLSVGYAAHDAERVELHLEESFTFRVATPEAAVAIR